jgi:SOS response regulatory protein OraA/RecX
LPCAGALGERIVRETAEKGSKNYQILCKLMDRGARIEATESPELLREEYSHIKAILEAKTDKEKTEAGAGYDQVKDRLMENRDTFIAKTISSTLKDGETGLLFIGASHNVIPKIAKDIEIKILD